LNSPIESAAIVVEAYGYAPASPLLDTCDAWTYLELDGDGNPIHPLSTVAATPPVQEIDWQSILEARSRESFRAGLEQGLEEGSAAEREAQQRAHAADLERLASALAQLTGGFVAERNRYFERVEQEVARLALAIASRILRREAQVDPLLLLGAARVALGQLSASTAIRLRVPSTDAELWKEALALLPNRDLQPEIIPDTHLSLGNCLLETELGSADLGVRAQIGEIERSFFDRAPASSEPVAVQHP
jgi:flagellar assembly protein FliH